MLFEFKFPDVGEGVHEGKILQLTFKPGDKVEAGDILAVVETDKVVAEIPSSKDGVLKKYGAEEGQVIHVGSVLAYIETEGAEQPAKEPIDEAGSVVGELEGPGDTIMPVSGEGVSDLAPEAVSLVQGKTRTLATPVARKLASDNNLDISLLKGSGPSGRVMKKDVLQAIGSPGQSQAPAGIIPVQPAQAIVMAPAGGREIIEFSTTRKTIAGNMELSQQIPAFVIQDFTTIDELATYRSKLKEDGNRISFQPFFMKAMAVALKKYPIVNANYDPQKQETTLYGDVNIGIAVGTDEGLMVPVIKQVQNKTIQQINSEMMDLADRAKSRKLKLDELRGGTISITNYGSFGGVYGRPMISAPQVSILGFGRIHQAPVVMDDKIVPGTILPVSMTCDHRVVDGAPAASFLTYFLQLLGSLQKLLIEL